MSLTFASLEISAMNNATLGEIFTKNITVSVPVSLADGQLVTLRELLSPRLDVTTKADDTLNTANESSAELVVFSDLTLATFEQFLTQAKLTVIALNAINERLGKTSFRFAVNCDDVEASKNTLSELAIKAKAEAALLENVPLLHEPGVVVMDMDSTAIQIECIDEIAMLAGVGEQVAEVTELAMQGKLDFAESLRARVAKLKDAPEDILANVANELPLMPGLKAMVKFLQQHNWTLAIASGGFTYFADKLKSELNLDAAVANTLEIVDGKLTGKVLGDIVDANTKATVVEQLVNDNAIPLVQTIAIGDGANDLVMMSKANLGIAYKAKPIVLKQAKSAINFSDLTTAVHWLK